MTKLESLFTSRLLSHSAVVRIAIITIMAIAMFLVFMPNPTFAGRVNLEIFPPPKIVKFITRFYNAIVHKYEQDEPFANMPEIA